VLKKLFSLDNRTWSASFFNVVAMASALWALLNAKNANGTSLLMLFIFLYVQITYAQLGYRSRSQALLWGMVLSAVCTVGCILRVLILRGIL